MEPRLTTLLHKTHEEIRQLDALHSCKICQYTLIQKSLFGVINFISIEVFECGLLRAFIMRLVSYRLLCRQNFGKKPKQFSLDEVNIVSLN